MPNDTTDRSPPTDEPENHTPYTFSVYADAVSTDSAETWSIADAFSFVRSADSKAPNAPFPLKHQTEIIRRAARGGKARESETNRRKRALLSPTPSGLFSQRGGSRLLRHSGIVHLDFDKLGEPGTEEAAAVSARLRDRLAEHRAVSLAFVSPRGNGVKAWILIDDPPLVDAGDLGRARSEHKAAWRIVRDVFAEYGEIQSDPACKDITRICWLSYDPDARFREPNECEPLDWRSALGTQQAAAEIVEREQTARGRGPLLREWEAILKSFEGLGEGGTPLINGQPMQDAEGDAVIGRNEAMNMAWYIAGTLASAAHLRKLEARDALVQANATMADPLDADELMLILRDGEGSGYEAGLQRPRKTREEKERRENTAGRADDLARVVLEWLRSAHQHKHPLEAGQAQTGTLTYIAWRDGFYERRGANWEAQDEMIIELQLRDHLRGQFENVRRSEVVNAMADLKLDAMPPAADTAVLPMIYRMLPFHLDEGELLRGGVFRNQVVDVLDSGEIRQSDLSARAFVTTRRACDWDPNAPAPAQWLEFLDLILPDPEQQRLLHQYIGALLVNRAAADQKVLFLKGPGGNGKGTVVRTITHMLGPGAVAASNVNTLGRPFGREGLVGKDLLTISDIGKVPRRNPDEYYAGLDTLRLVTGGGLVNIERKNKIDLSVELRCGVIADSNLEVDFVRGADDAAAWMRRLLVLAFDVALPQPSIRDFEDRFIVEAAGIARLAVEEYSTMRKASRNGADERAMWARPESSRVLEGKILAGKLGSVKAFADQLVYEEGASVTRKELREAYRRADSRSGPSQYSALYTELETRNGVYEGKPRRERGYFGVRLPDGAVRPLDESADSASAGAANACTCGSPSENPADHELGCPIELGAEWERNDGETR